MRWLRSFFDNNSLFGRLMTRCGILIAGNILFLIFSIPVFTIGAAWTALYYTMFKTLREKGEINPFRVFWIGFRENFRQAVIIFILFAFLAVFLILEIFWCGQFENPVALFRYGLMALLLTEIVIASYIFPVMSVFRGDFRQLISDSVYFAVRRPVTLILILFLHIMPFVITFLDARRLPLYAFLWCVIGFSGIAMSCANWLYKQFAPLLDSNQTGDDETANLENAEKSEREILEEMKKLGM